jgi:hypothetical protein
MKINKYAILGSSLKEDNPPIFYSDSIKSDTAKISQAQDVSSDITLSLKDKYLTGYCDEFNIKQEKLYLKYTEILDPDENRGDLREHNVSFDLAVEPNADITNTRMYLVFENMSLKECKYSEIENRFLRITGDDVTEYNLTHPNLSLTLYPSEYANNLTIQSTNNTFSYYGIPE